MVGEGITGIYIYIKYNTCRLTYVLILMQFLVYSSENASSKDLEVIDAIFSYIGISQNVPESLVNAIGGLSGSGPAFVSCYNNITVTRELKTQSSQYHLIL